MCISAAPVPTPTINTPPHVLYDFGVTTAPKVRSKTKSKQNCATSISAVNEEEPSNSTSNESVDREISDELGRRTRFNALKSGSIDVRRVDDVGQQSNQTMLQQEQHTRSEKKAKSITQIDNTRTTATAAAAHQQQQHHPMTIQNSVYEMQQQQKYKQLSKVQEEQQQHLITVENSIKQIQEQQQHQKLNLGTARTPNGFLSANLFTSTKLQNCDIKPSPYKRLKNTEFQSSSAEATTEGDTAPRIGAASTDASLSLLSGVDEVDSSTSLEHYIHLPICDTQGHTMPSVVDPPKTLWRSLVADFDTDSDASRFNN